MGVTIYISQTLCHTVKYIKLKIFNTSINNMTACNANTKETNDKM